MAIKWTPWFNVPTKKRLELLSIGFFIFCFLPIGLLSLSILIMLYILVTKLITNGACLSPYLHALMYFICILSIVCWKYFYASNLCTVFRILVLWLEYGWPWRTRRWVNIYCQINSVDFLCLIHLWCNFSVEWTG